MESTLPCLKFKNVVKNYATTQALKSISTNVFPGEKVAILGCNGAGKSTFLNIATGLILPTSGEVEILNNSPFSQSTKEQFAFLPQTLKFPSFLKVKDVIQIVEKHFRKALDLAILKRLELLELKDKYCHMLSGGEERKIGFALSLIGERPFLILDEPTTNIDLISKREIHDLLNMHLAKNNKALLFSSHEMSEVERLADRVVVLNHGKIVQEGSVQQIKKSFSLMKVCFDCQKTDLLLKSAIKTYFKNSRYTLYGEDGDEIVREIVTSGHSFKNLTIEQSGLEEIFLKIWRSK